MKNKTKFGFGHVFWVIFKGIALLCLVKGSDATFGLNEVLGKA